jgi:hypothetical protein
MRIYYKALDFKDKRTRNPQSGQIGAPKIQAGAHITLYRDLDVDPHTVVAEAKGEVYHYPWGSDCIGIVDVARTYPKPAEPERKKAG